eukprot:TRINITY_DN2448_c0_g1_i1.p1 TRINITY_DN2448_c0_g1~~TRINITY_DN2448_c0_g1_i1.p1  ORF type:complete len:226 (-),score=45.26 TRINITY_DN2448_c0_g1_i1:329-1006(-)
MNSPYFTQYLWNGINPYLYSEYTVSNHVSNPMYPMISYSYITPDSNVPKISNMPNFPYYFVPNLSDVVEKKQMEPARKTVIEKKKKIEKPQPPQPLQTTRSEKKIGNLCNFLKNKLSETPLTRNEIAEMSGFSRQRVSTAVSVFKALGLITEINGNDSEITEKLEKKGLLKYSPKVHDAYLSFNENVADKIFAARHQVRILKQQLYNQSLEMIGIVSSERADEIK